MPMTRTSSSVVQKKTLPLLSDQCLHNIEKWIERNRLIVNCDKSNAVALITRNSRFQKPDLYLSSNPVNYKDEFNFLGVWIDEGLTWNKHCDRLLDRLNRGCYVLRTLKDVLDKPSLRSAYYAYFNSILSYGIILWGCSGFVSSVFRVQKRAIRIISGRPPGFSCRSLFPEWNIYTVHNLYIFNIALFVYKHLETFESLNTNHQYNTRFGNNLSYDRHNLSLYEKRPRYMGVKVWNRLPRFVRDSGSQVEFRGNLKKFFQGRYYYSLNEFFND
jgi:hypothetical protein